MKSSFAGLVAAAVLAAMVMSGCTQRILDFTVISSKNVSMRVKDSGKGQRVKGEDMAVYIIFPLGMPQVKGAVDKAIESAGTGYDALIDGVIYYKYNVFLLFGTYGYQVEGTPIKTAELIAELRQRGEDVDKYFADHSILYSSSKLPMNEQSGR